MIPKTTKNKKFWQTVAIEVTDYQASYKHNQGPVVCLSAMKSAFRFIYNGLYPCDG